MIRLAIRADASIEMGAGHVKRCLALAHALVDCGVDVVFISRAMDGLSETLLGGAHFDCRWLPGARDGLALTDAQQTADLLGDWAPHMVVVDHYALEASWHQYLRRTLGARLVVIDDLADRSLAPDVLVDHNLHADHALKYRSVLACQTKILGGPRFALLDAVYANSARYRFSDTVHSIGIFMGGSDPDGVCLKALRACRQGAGFRGLIEVVSSPLSPHHADLVSECQRWPDTSLLHDLPNLADFFARHDLQLGAGGGANWERCCMGVPTVACAIAPNQITSLPMLDDLGALVWAQNAGDLESALARAVTEMLGQPQRRRGLAESAARLVDGHGAARAAAVLACTAGAPVSLRMAELQDEQLLLDWANDPMVRANAFHPEPITQQQHAQWFRKRLADRSQYRIWIAEATNGVAVGQVRFEWTDQGWEIGYSLDSAFRQIGMGQRLLQAALVELPTAVDGTQVIARVKPGNLASAQIFRRLGFHQTDASDARGAHWLFSMQWPAG